MPAPIIVDASPLVSLCNQLDPGFRGCSAALQRIPGGTPLITTLAAVTEAMYLLRQVTGGRAHLFRLVLGGVVVLDQLPYGSLGRIRDLMHRYANLPMDFADATVVELAERLGSSTILTLDERDFRIYQPRHVEHFRLLPADLEA